MQTPPPPLAATDSTDPAEAERAHRRWRLVGIGALCLSVLVALTLTLLVITAPPPLAKVAVPDVTGMSLPEAVAVLQDKHLTLGTVADIDSPQDLEGKVVIQRPSEKTQVDENTPVNVEIDSS